MVTGPASPTLASTWGLDRTGPAWAARVHPPAGGQDHLGLGSVSSDRILPTLSPGINVLTIHPRYWSFYAWVLDEYWTHKGPKNAANFTPFYRQRDALFAFACQLCQAPEHKTLTGNIVGSQRTAGPAREHDEFDPNFEYIKERLGGFGLYYRATMEATGIISRADPANGLAYDTVTPQGRALARAYGKAVATTRLVSEFLTQAAVPGPVPKDVLEEFALRGCLCQLRTAEQFDRPLLQDLFTHGGDPDGARRRTFQFLLDACTTAHQTGLNRDRYRELIYFRSLDDGKYVPNTQTTGAARQWRLYQAREYFGFALNRLWAWLVRRGHDLSQDGIALVPMTQIRALLEQELDANSFVNEREAAGLVITARTPATEFLYWITAQVDITVGIDDIWPRHVTLDEHALYQWCNSRVDDADTLVSMLAVLLLVYQRIGTLQRLVSLGRDRSIVAEGSSARIGMERFFTLLRTQMEDEPTLLELLVWVYERHIVPQHERVAMAKLVNGDTFRFRRVGAAMQFFGGDAPATFNDSRFDALSTSIHELGLVSSLHLPDRKLTAAGKKLLTTGDLPTGAMEAATTLDVMGA